MKTSSPEDKADMLKKVAISHGDRLSVISVSRLDGIKDEIEAFRNTEALNGFQKWIVEQLYHLEVPESGIPIRTIIIVAIPHPAYAKVRFVTEAKQCDCLSLVMSDFEAAHRYLSDHLEAMGCHLVPATNLPLKRLAARSGLATYGRNNICYVEGMGSHFSLAAFFSDLDSQRVDDWSDLRMAKACTGCKVCLRSCPTGAIRADRFLIDNERCLSCLNESSADFPEWLPNSAHHSVYDCLKCQIDCPMNRPFAHDVLDTILFNEQETKLILEGRKFETFHSGLKNKVKMLGMHHWPDGIPRNVRLLFEMTGTER